MFFTSFRYENHIQLSNAVGSVIGLTSSLIILITYYRFKSMRASLSKKLVVYQSLCVFVEGCNNLFLSPTNSVACKIQGFLNNYLILCDFMWGSVVIYVLVRCTSGPIGSLSVYKPHESLTTFQLLCWGLPLIPSCLPFITGTVVRYRRDVLYCACLIALLPCCLNSIPNSRTFIYITICICIRSHYFLFVYICTYVCIALHQMTTI
jgi:hypothetical protein